MKQKDILLLIVSSFVLIVFWIIFNIYHNIVTSTIPESLNVQIAPINATFDTKTISYLKQRIQVIPIYNYIATQSAPIPTPTIPPASQSALIQNTSTQSASTSGGTLK